MQRRIKEKQKGDNSMGKGKAVLAFAVAAGMVGMACRTGFGGGYRRRSAGIKS